MINVLCRRVIRYPLLCRLIGWGTLLFAIFNVSYMALLALRMPFNGPCWGVGILLNAVAILYSCVARKFISEDWPLATMVLFPGNGKQWRLLHGAFVEGCARLAAIPLDCADLFVDEAQLGRGRGRGGAIRS